MPPRTWNGKSKIVPGGPIGPCGSSSATRGLAQQHPNRLPAANIADARHIDHLVARTVGPPRVPGRGTVSVGEDLEVSARTQGHHRAHRGHDPSLEGQPPRIHGVRRCRHRRVAVIARTDSHLDASDRCARLHRDPGGRQGTPNEPLGEGVSDLTVDLTDQPESDIQALHHHPLRAHLGEPNLGEGRAQGFHGDHTRRREIPGNGPSRCSIDEPAALVLCEQRELVTMLGQAGDQLHDGVHGQLAAGRHLRLDRWGCLLPGDVHPRRPATTRVLAGAGDDKSRLGQDIEVVARDVGVEAEHLRGLTGGDRLAFRTQAAVDPGACGDGQDLLDHLVVTHPTTAPVLAHRTRDPIPDTAAATTAAYGCGGHLRAGGRNAHRVRHRQRCRVPGGRRTATVASLAPAAPATTPVPSDDVDPGRCRVRARFRSVPHNAPWSEPLLADGPGSTDEETWLHLLVLTERSGGSAELLPGLEFLDHSVHDAPLQPDSLQAMRNCDVVLIDATADLRRAAGASRAASLQEPVRPVLVVMPEGGLAAIKVTWGFDDWLLPQASPAELETRLRLARDRASSEQPQRAANVGDLVVDEDSYQVRLRGEPLDLTYKEFELLKALANSPNRVFTRELLLQEVWGYDYFGGSRTVDVHVRRLRAKLGPEYEQMIVTVRGVGYKLVPPGQRTHRGPEDMVEEASAAS